MNYLDIFFLGLFIAVVVGYFVMDKKEKVDIKDADDLRKKLLKKAIEKTEINGLIVNSGMFIKDVITSFYSGEKEKLRKLTTKSLFAQLEKYIDSSDKNEVKKLIDVSEVIVKTTDEKNPKEAVIEFKTSQVYYVKNSAGKVIKGDDNQLINVKDIWTVKIENSKKWVLKDIVKV